MGEFQRGLIDWAVAARTLEGQAASGDQHWVSQGPAESRLAVIDGVGHGNEAARASRLAVAALDQNARESSLDLFQRCHECLRTTRGAVMSLAAFSASDNTVSWLGVGNVEGVILRRQFRGPDGQEALVLRSGVLGVRMPQLFASVVPVAAGDTMILTTDGLREGFADHTNRHDSPRQIADWILDHYGRGTDDALVLVARYLHEKADATTR
jgi:serine/threonine protein phosphatase PrpC